MITTNPINDEIDIEITSEGSGVSPSFNDLIHESRDSRKSGSRSVSLEATANNASILSCYVNLANTILGSGMLGLPYAYANSGWVLGSILLIVSCTSSAFALHTLSLCAMSLPGPSSFYSVGHHVMPAFTLLIDFAVAIKCFGVATSYLIVIGDLMPDVMEQMDAPKIWHSRYIWVLFGWAIVAPLSCLRNLDSLKFTSFVSIVFVAFLTFLIIFYALEVGTLDPCQDIDDDETCVGDKSNFVADMNTMRVLSIFIFGFTCQQVCCFHQL
jgi:amino acid permease